MTAWTETACAKLNLSLDVTGRRADGYHLLSMVCQTVTLSDTLAFERRPGGLRVMCPGAQGIPDGPGNLVYRAAEAFFRETGETDQSVTIIVTKRIPSQAGLGGGSADAAAALRGLCRLYRRPLSYERLCVLALGIGADVPFCIQGGTALAEGIGERLTPLPEMPACTIVLCKPQVGISTAEAYRKIDAAEAMPGARYTPGVLRALESGNLDALSASLGNRFADVLHVPEVDALQKGLLAAGALGACMTGSGSAVFGLFREEAVARRAAAQLAQNGTQAFVCRAAGTTVPERKVPSI